MSLNLELEINAVKLRIQIISDKLCVYFTIRDKRITSNIIQDPIKFLSSYTTQIDYLKLEPLVPYFKWICDLTTLFLQDLYQATKDASVNNQKRFKKPHLLSIFFQKASRQRLMLGLTLLAYLTAQKADPENQVFDSLSLLQEIVLRSKLNLNALLIFFQLFNSMLSSDSWINTSNEFTHFLNPVLPDQFFTHQETLRKLLQSNLVFIMMVHSREYVNKITNEAAKGVMLQGCLAALFMCEKVYSIIGDGQAFDLFDFTPIRKGMRRVCTTFDGHATTSIIEKKCICGGDLR